MSSPDIVHTQCDSHRLSPISVVVPAYNEQHAIHSTIESIIATVANAFSDYELIVVNDGSTDETGRILESYTNVRVIQHTENRGYGASLKTGIRHARYDLVVITDADQTYPVERIPDLVKLAAGADMVVGARTAKGAKQSETRQFAKWFLVCFAQWLVRRPIPDLNSGLRVMKKPVLDRFVNILPDGFSFTTTITIAMMSNNYVVHYEPIAYEKRVGRSKIRPIRDTLQFLQLILRTGMYFAPLRVFMPVAIAFFLGFLVSLAIDIYRMNLTESTLLLLIAAAQLAMFTLLTDMLDKRTR